MSHHLNTLGSTGKLRKTAAVSGLHTLPSARSASGNIFEPSSCWASSVVQQLVLCTGHISHYFLTESTQKDLKNHKGGHTNHCCNCPHSNTSTIQAPIVTYLGCLPDMGRTPVRPQVKGRIVSDQCSLLAREKSKEAANRQRPRHCCLARGAGLDKPHVGNIRQENKRKPILSAKPPNPFGKVHSPAPLLRGSPVTSVTGLSKNVSASA